jgi:hypothetical protein
MNQEISVRPLLMVEDAAVGASIAEEDKVEVDVAEVAIYT